MNYYNTYKDIYFDSNFIKKINQEGNNLIFDELKELYRTLLHEIEKEYERDMQNFFY